MLLLSEKLKVRVLPPGETMVVDVKTTLPSLLIGLLDFVIAHNFDSDRVVVRMSGDRLVAAIGFYLERWDAGVALIHAIPKQERVSR